MAIEALSFEIFYSRGSVLARRCEITGIGVMAGNNVSHAHNKTRRRFLPNVQQMTLFSETLGRVRLKVTATALRSIEQNGGLDAYLLETPTRKLTDSALKIRKRIKKAHAKVAA